MYNEQRRVTIRTSASANNFWSRERSSSEYAKDGTVIPLIDGRVALPYQRQVAVDAPNPCSLPSPPPSVDVVTCPQDSPYLNLKSSDTVQEAKAPASMTDAFLELRRENAGLRRENERLRTQCDAVMRLNATLAQSVAAQIQACQDVTKLRPI